MKKFLVIVVVNWRTFWVYDTYYDYLIEAANESEAREKAKQVAYYVDLDSIEEITDGVAESLKRINRTKELPNGITQIIMF